jgi:hypothetical protein
MGYVGSVGWSAEFDMGRNRKSFQDKPHFGYDAKKNDEQFFNLCGWTDNEWL